MKNTTIYLILVSAILGISVFINVSTGLKLRKCLLTDIKTCDTIYKNDTFYITINKDVPKPYKVVKVDTFKIPVFADTIAILEEYYSKYLSVNYYSDTLSDSNIVAIIDEIICENEMKSRGFKYQLLIEPTVINNIVEDSQNGIYGGLISNFYDEKIGIGLSAGYINKQGYYIGLQYDFIHKAPGIMLTKRIW
jgi:hypothetical protein